MNPAIGELVTVAEAAALLRVAPSTIRRWIRQGDIPAYRIGPRRVAIERAALSAVVAPARSPGGIAAQPVEVERPAERKLTPEEQQRGLAALERAERRSRELLARNGGRLFPSSVPIIHEMREERTRQLTERQP